MKEWITVEDSEKNLIEINTYVVYQNDELKTKNYDNQRQFITPTLD